MGLERATKILNFKGLERYIFGDMVLERGGVERDKGCRLCD